MTTAARPVDRDVVIPASGVALPGNLTIPEGAVGIVLFAHGSGSSRLSPRNQYVAAALRGAGVGTLLFDLLTEGETRSRANVFDIGLLARRLGDATAWMDAQPEADGKPLGYFGASTGAAAALVAAAHARQPVTAVVSRGGRPDLAGDALSAVKAATLLVVGGLDHQVIDLNRIALARLQCTKQLVIVPGATHLFEEPGTLEEVARLAADWFVRHLRLPAAPS